MDGKNGRAKVISRDEAGRILTEVHLLNEKGGTFYHRGVWYEYPAGWGEAEGTCTPSGHERSTCH